jgi:excisionase family DNA binding protein
MNTKNNIPADPKPALTLCEAAHLLRMSVPTLRKLIRAGKVPAYNVGTGERAHYRVPSDYVNSHRWTR